MQSDRVLPAGTFLAAWFEYQSLPTPDSGIWSPDSGGALGAQWSAVAQGHPAAATTAGEICSHLIFHCLKTSANLCHVVRLLIITAYSKGCFTGFFYFLLAFGQRVKSDWCRCIVHLVLLYGLVRVLWLVTDCCTCFSQFTLLWLVLAAVLVYGLSWCYADIISKLNDQNYHLWHLQCVCYSGVLVRYIISLTRLLLRRLMQRLLQPGGSVTIVWACKSQSSYNLLVSSARDMWEYLQQCYTHNWALRVSLLERHHNLRQHDMSIQEFYNAFTHITWQLDCVMPKAILVVTVPQPRRNLIRSMTWLTSLRIFAQSSVLLWLSLLHIPCFSPWWLLLLWISKMFLCLQLCKRPGYLLGSARSFILS